MNPFSDIFLAYPLDFCVSRSDNGIIATKLVNKLPRFSAFSLPDSKHLK